MCKCSTNEAIVKGFINVAELPRQDPPGQMHVIVMHAVKIQVVL